jgi:hypothetical protein
MAQKISGGCACGAIRYECNADPVIMLNCHCRDYQRASGSAYAAVVVVPKSAIAMRGEPRYYKVVGNAGNAIERGFCPACGSQVTAKLERLPDVLALQAGSLDDPSVHRPTMDVFTSSAQPWDHLGSYESQHSKAYPRPAIVIAISTARVCRGWRADES